MSRRWDPFLFMLAAILFALFAAFRAAGPLLRAASKLGSRELAWPMIAASPIYWAVAVLVRLALGAFLLWYALRLRRRRLWQGYVALAGAALVVHFADPALWLFVGLG